VQFLSENEEKTSRNSSPTSHDSGIPSDSESNLTSNIEEDKLDDSSGVSIGSDRSTSTSPDSLDLNEDLIPQAPPLLDSSLIDPLQIGQHVYESRKSQILNAKGTLKAPKNNKERKNSIISDEISSFQFFLHEKDFEEHSTGDDSTSLVSEEDFAGIKDQWTRNIPEDGSLTIRSHRGTIRGVKNRVRAGIATFLRDPSFKNFGDREQRVVVIYVTTLSILRDTWARCVKVRQILRNLLIKVDERDVFMSRENQVELMDRMAMVEVNLPQVFVNGQYLGDADVIEKLNETGELRKILRPYKSLTVTTVCGKCGGFRMLPCPICDGSKKSMHRNDFTEQFIALRCTVCDDCGLVKCDKC
jgi:glutaredoxin-related protein